MHELSPKLPQPRVITHIPHMSLCRQTFHIPEGSQDTAYRVTVVEQGDIEIGAVQRGFPLHRNIVASREHVTAVVDRFIAIAGGYGVRKGRRAEPLVRIGGCERTTRALVLLDKNCRTRHGRHGQRHEADQFGNTVIHANPQKATTSGNR